MRPPRPSGSSTRSRNCGLGRGDREPAAARGKGIGTPLVWRFRSPHHFCASRKCGTSEPADVPPSATFALEDDVASRSLLASASVYSMQSIISVSKLSKTYASGFRALKSIDLDIRRGEIFALLGPNGAGKTTLISIICGIVTLSEGKVSVAGHDIVRDYRLTRSMIGLVPQELTTDAFETVWATVSFSRGLFGKPHNPDVVAKVLKELSLWDKKDNKIMTLSGGMKRRVLIAKALAHEPQILFLDEPTAGVDVELRQDMWEIVRSLR